MVWMVRIWELYPSKKLFEKTFPRYISHPNPHQPLHLVKKLLIHHWRSWSVSKKLLQKSYRQNPYSLVIHSWCYGVILEQLELLEYFLKLYAEEKHFEKNFTEIYLHSKCAPSTPTTETTPKLHLLYIILFAQQAVWSVHYFSNTQPTMVYFPQDVFQHILSYTLDPYKEDRKKHAEVWQCIKVDKRCYCERDNVWRATAKVPKSKAQKPDHWGTEEVVFGRVETNFDWDLYEERGYAPSLWSHKWKRQGCAVVELFTRQYE